MNFDNGIEFDPGFTMHLSLISRDIVNFYNSLNMYPKFPQKKQQFKVYNSKLLRLIERNVGFYAGCVLWAGIAGNHPDKPILNNICFGGENNEEENVAEVRFVRDYLQRFQKDMKYYVGQDFEIPTIFLTILDDYEDFLKINEGFINVKLAGDLKLPQSVKKISDDTEKQLMPQIEAVLESGNFKSMIEVYSLVK